MYLNLNSKIEFVIVKSSIIASIAGIFVFNLFLYIIMVFAIEMYDF